MQERKHLVDESGFEVIRAGKEFIAPVDDERDSSERSWQGARRELEMKEYIRDESLDLVEPIQFDDENRFERTCQDGERLFDFQFVTDNYGYETSWALEMKDGNNWDILYFGPPGNSNYQDNTLYRGVYCIEDSHNYRLTIKDARGDGFCCNYGRGSYKFSVDGETQFDSEYARTFDDEAKHQFYLDPKSSSSISGQMTGRAPSPYCGENAEQIRIKISTDFYGAETSWALKKASNNEVIKEVKMGTYGEYSIDDVSVCVPINTGEVIFEIKDDIGDGMCCRDGDGYYKLYKDDDLMVYGSDFTSGKSRSHKIILGYWNKLKMTQREQEYLDAHNSRRKTWHKNLGMPYVPMKYSYGLAQDATSWANELLKDCDDTGIKHEPNVDQGENLAKNTGSGTWGSLYPVENIVRRWVEREETWDFPENAHFTQALWRASRYLGCGESSKVMNQMTGEMCRIQVCRYVRAGNCNMGAFRASQGDNWKVPMLMDDSKCGAACPPEGCF